MAGGDYFAEDVRRQLIDKFGADQTTQGGLVVRTTLDPALQAAADKALHDGLLHYDQKRGGWRGPVTRLSSGPALRVTWANALAATPRPPGMLPSWRLAVVLEETDTEAKLGVLDHPPGGVAAVPRVLPLLLADTTWARPVKDGAVGATPRKLGDVLQPGDVVMTEQVPAQAAQGKSTARVERLLLRQIPQVQGALVSHRPGDRARAGAVRRLVVRDEPVRPRDPGQAPARLQLQAVRLSDGAGAERSRRRSDSWTRRSCSTRAPPANGGRAITSSDFNGSVPLHVALEKSLNLVTVRVADRIGMDAVAKTAIAFHMVDNMPHVLPAALGAVDTTVLREAGAYAVDRGRRARGDRRR